MGPNRRVLLVGWDAADWKVIHPLIDAGRMPNVRRLVEEGCSGPLATIHPPLSPMLWTSIATGKRPYQHGIHGFTEPTSDARGIQPVTNLSRRSKAVWNILNQNGIRSVVVGWWPSHPAEPIDGVMVSDHYHRAYGALSDDWPMPEGAVHPRDLSATLAELRLHPEEVPGELIEAFVPRAREVDQDQDPRLALLARTLAECISIHSAATWLLDNRPWEFFAVYYDAIDHFCHGFMRYHPPRRAHIPEREFELYRGVVAAAYELHDRMLGTLLAKAGEEVTVILMSDHGFHPDHLRPSVIPRVPAGPAVEHRDFGVLAIRGAGIRRDELVHGASILDLTPTVLTLFGLPSGEDMDGRPLRDIFDDPPRSRAIGSWELVPGRDGCHPAGTRLDPVAVRETLDQLVALGYIAPPDENAGRAVADAVRELRYNLGESYQDADRHPEAIDIFRELRRADPDEQRFGVRLFVSCQAMGLVEDMRSIVEDLDGRRRALFLESLPRLAEWRKVAEERQSARAVESEDPLLSREEQEEVARWENLSRFQPAVVDYLKAQLLAAERRYGEALSTLQRVADADQSRPGLLLQAAALYRMLGQWDDAGRAFRKALALDPDNPHAHLGLSRLAFRRRDYPRVAESALEAVQRMYHYPMAHFLLGVALAAMGRPDAAAGALRTALSQNPNFPQAHLRLAMLLRDSLGDPAGAEEHMAYYRELRRGVRRNETRRIGKEIVDRLPEEPDAPLMPPVTDEIVVVSGLPRSGTSLLMQMLGAGGFPLFTDGVRAPDADNPLGYFELDAVRRLHEDTVWIFEARGRAVKIVAPLLGALPDGERYRVLFVERNLDELLASQRQMLMRAGRTAEDSPERRTRLKQEYSRIVARAKDLLHARAVPTLNLGRRTLIDDPAGAAARINRFLGGVLNPDRMAAAVRPELDRHRF